LAVFPFGRFPLGRFPRGRFPLGRFPGGRFPLGRFPLGRLFIIFFNVTAPITTLMWRSGMWSMDPYPPLGVWGFNPGKNFELVLCCK